MRKTDIFDIRLGSTNAQYVNLNKGLMKKRKAYVGILELNVMKIYLKELGSKLTLKYFILKIIIEKEIAIALLYYLRITEKMYMMKFYIFLSIKIKFMRG